MRVDDRYWLDYDSVAFAVLMVALGIVELSYWAFEGQMHLRSQILGMLVAVLLAVIFVSMLKAQNENVSASQYLSASSFH